MPEARIQKVLAEAGIASRRGAEALVAAGRVTIDGRAAQVGERVDPRLATIAVDGRLLGSPPHHVYLALNKPAGVTSTVSDRHAARTVVQLVAPATRERAGRLYPVGRLDQESEGLLLLTNDGAWAQRLLHPRYGVEREYAIGLRTALTASQAEALQQGVELEEGLGRLLGLRPATPVETAKLAHLVTPLPRDLHWYRATLRQGWRRQLRRMFAAVGAPVARLVRVRLGTLWLEGLAAGAVRELSAREAERVSRGSAPGEAQLPADERLQAKGAGSGGLVVSLDGPASSGKSTVGAAAAARLGYRFCDTGLFYRGLTWLARRRGVGDDDAGALAALVPLLHLRADRQGRLTHVLVEDQDVTDRVHEPGVDAHVSAVARHAAVRAALRPRQRELARGGRIIVAGRDIGSVILPDADLKLFIHASVEERARRRAEQRGVPLGSDAHRAIEEDLRRRDGLDSGRAVAPLRVPEGAQVIESDGNVFEQTVEAVVAAIRTREAQAAAG